MLGSPSQLYFLQELKDERREMEKDLRRDIERPGDLDANTPRSINEEWLDEEEGDEDGGVGDGGGGGGGSVLDRLMDGELNAKSKMEEEVRRKREKEEASTEEERHAKELHEKNACVRIQAFMRGAVYRGELKRMKEEEEEADRRLILADVLVDMIEELEWLHEPSLMSRQGHGDVFESEEELAKNVLAQWTSYDAPMKDIRNLLIDVVEEIVLELGTEVDILEDIEEVMEVPEMGLGFQLAAEEASEEKEKKENKILVKGSEEYEKLLRSHLDRQQREDEESGRNSNNRALSRAHVSLVEQCRREGVPLNKREVWLKEHANDVDPYDVRAETQHDGASSEVKAADGTTIVTGIARVDYRPWKQRLHRRTYWPEIAMIQGTFVRGRIMGNVLVRFHDGATYSGPWVDRQEKRSLHHRGTWKTIEDNV